MLRRTVQRSLHSRSGNLLMSQAGGDAQPEAHASYMDRRNYWNLRARHYLHEAVGFGIVNIFISGTTTASVALDSPWVPWALPARAVGTVVSTILGHIASRGRGKALTYAELGAPTDVKLGERPAWPRDQPGNSGVSRHGQVR